jgi:hypothetical protein
MDEGPYQAAAFAVSLLIFGLVIWLFGRGLQQFFLARAMLRKWRQDAGLPAYQSDWSWDEYKMGKYPKRPDECTSAYNKAQLQIIGALALSAVAIFFLNVAMDWPFSQD